MASQVNPSAQAVSQSVRQANKVKGYVDEQLKKTREQVKTNDLIFGILMLIAFVIGFMLLAAIVDGWIWPFSVAMRWLCLITLILGCVGYFSYAILPLLFKKINPDYVAKMIEEAKPGFKNSVLNYVSFRKKPNGLKPAVFDAVSRQAATDLSTVPSDATVDRSNLINIGFVLCLLTLFAVSYKVFSPKDPLQTFFRVLAPAGKIAKPAVVEISNVDPGDTKVFFGEVLPIRATVKGSHVPEDVKLVYSTADGQLINQNVSMVPGDIPDQYEVELSMAGGGIQQSLTYFVTARDGRSPDYEVTVQPNPSIAIESLVIKPPAYTQLAERTLTGQGDIEAIEGTKVTVHALANLPIDVAYVELLIQIGGGRDIADQADAEREYKLAATPIEMQSEGKSAIGRFQVLLNAKRDRPLATHYRIKFVSEDGDRNNDANIYPIRVIPDLAPEVRFRNPIQTDLQIPQNGAVGIDIEASDADFAISYVSLQMEHERVKKLDLKLPLKSNDANRHVDAKYIIRPSELGLKPGDKAIFYAVAADNRVSPHSDQPNPNVTRTGNYTLTILDPDPNQQNENDDQRNEQNQDEQSDEGEKQDQSNEEQSNDSESESEDGQEGEGEGEESGQESEGAENGEGGGESEGGEDSEQENMENQNSESESDGSGNGSGSNSNSEGNNEPGNDSEQSEGGEENGEDSADSENSEGQNGEQQPNAGEENGSKDQNTGTDSNDGGEGEESDSNRQNSEGQNSESNTEGNQSEDGSGNQRSNDGQSSDSNTNEGQSANADGQSNDAQSNPGEGGNSDEEGTRDNDLMSGQQEEVSDNASDGERIKKMQEHFEQNPQKDSGDQSQDSQDNSGEEKQQAEEGETEGGNAGEDGNPEGSEKQTDDSSDETGSEDSKRDGGEPGQERGQEKSENGGGESQDTQPEKDDQNTGQTQSGNNSENTENEQPENGREENSESGDTEKSDGQKENEGSEDSEQKKNEGDQQKGKQGGSENSESQGGSEQKTDGGEEGQEGSQSGSEGEKSGESKDGKGQGEGSKSDKQSNSEGSEGQSQDQGGEGESSEGGEGQSSSESSGKSEGSSSENGQPGSESSSTDAGTGSQKSSTGNGSPGGSAQGAINEAEEANLDHAKKATDLILKRLAEERNDPDPELLRKLKWSKEDLNEFLDRWEKMKDAAESGTVAKRKYEKAVKSLGLRPETAKRRVGQREERIEGLNQDGAINRPSAEIQNDFDAFLRDLGR